MIVAPQGSHKIGWARRNRLFRDLASCFRHILDWWNASAAARFDPSPVPLLSALLALEAVPPTSFVLIRQKAMALQSERRNQLDLQINLLAEKEATSILKALGEIARKLDIDLSHDGENGERGRRWRASPAISDLKRDKDKASAQGPV
ncbi:MAG: DUF1003 domain-containing protein [Bradyrhizobium sp.]|uniref:DUF1003 domain-containing protein n=1 Tax=Bradyrhizobium sp. TaxID=376 RepID=UPI001C28200F|nr:DUF1003 domain-containing protein [Pseudomonadota bacterium]MDE2068813.1 DUF1003 domain-containing protein [Bradyrhizobium sp.]MDE2243825.1 DUF1003 domain-containing protein [Bradyrhizobium sp.]